MIRKRRATVWDDCSLRARLRSAFALTSSGAPAGIARQALEIARHRACRRHSARRLCVGSVSSLLVGATLALLMLRISPRTVEDADMVPESAHKADGPSATGQRTVAGRTHGNITSPVGKPAAPVRSEKMEVGSGADRHRLNRRHDSPKASAPSEMEPDRLAQLRQMQAQDFEHAAQLLEQAGQMEPAYQLYSMSIEAAPTLDATLGAARALRRIDEAVSSASGEDGNPAAG